mmetsp:Transcript_9600/g.17500  ORF Transcript_9600/g.17500 Transcript_9600/m.17500 type:complete len:339 (+) Transcript_9600:111-1127(+)
MNMSVKNDQDVVVGAPNGDVDELGKRKFFPRVKHLIGNKEWEEFLNGILDAIESAGAPHAAAASHKANNAWYKAFDLVYSGIASDYSIPTGKNRYHKFKDKIVEVWCALEQDAPPDHPCREKGMMQLEVYRQACSEANKPPGGPVQSGTPKGPRTAAGGKGNVVLSTKRTFAGPAGGVLYRNLDEKEIIAKLPQPLQSLLNLRQMSKEMATCTGVRSQRKAMEDHAKKVDRAYLEAVNEYLGTNNGSTDAASGEDNDEEDDVKHEEKKEEVVMAKDEAYERAQCLALLYRYASAGTEQRSIAEAYQKAVDRYIAHVSHVPVPAEAQEDTEVDPVSINV